MVELSDENMKKLNEKISKIELQTGYLDEKKEVIFTIDFSKTKDKNSDNGEYSFLTSECHVDKWYQKGMIIKNKTATIDLPLIKFSTVLYQNGVDIRNNNDKYKITMMRLGKNKQYALKIIKIIKLNI